MKQNSRGLIHWRDNMSSIKDIRGRKVLDSRGNPTLEVDVILDSGVLGRESVPSGASTGRYEAHKLEDIDKSVVNVETLRSSLVGQNPKNQEKIDLAMINSDGSIRKTNLGANTTLAISLATCDAAAKDAKIPLYKYINSISGIKFNAFKIPIPMFNIVNGGKHADNNLSFQEFMVIPEGEKSFKQRLNAGVKVFHTLKDHLKKMNLSTNVGDEGGFAPRLNSNEEAMELIVHSINAAGFQPNSDISIGLDIAASSIQDLNSITYPLSPVAYYQKIVDEYPISLIEDGLGEDDWEEWSQLTQKLGSRIKLIGDDIFTTNFERLQEGITRKVANGIIIKPDQIGTLTETFKTIKLAKETGYVCVISHRSGETESNFIADLAVGVGAEYIKSGAPSRGERVTKYNQLLRIEEELQ